MQEQQTNLATSIEENLTRLNELLEQERSALLNGDTETIAGIAKEKEHLGMKLFEQKDLLENNEQLSAQIADLSKRVMELAQLNHMLLSQMYQHYHGMLELFMRLSGNNATYGNDGMMAIQNRPLKGSRILA